MVKDEYPGQEENEAGKDVLKETMQLEGNNRDNTDEDHRNEEMEWNEEYSDEITEQFEGDTYSVGKRSNAERLEIYIQIFIYLFINY